MGFWVSLLISLAITVVGELLRPKQKFKDPKPSALGDFSFPTADSTRVVSVWWGTCKLQGPNTTWFGDLETVAIKKKVKTGWFSSTTMTQGFKYYLGVQMVYGFGELDELLDFRLDGKSVFGSTPNQTDQGGFDGNVANWLSGLTVGNSYVTETTTISNTADYFGFEMNSPSLLGNDDPKNGVSGPVKIYKGTKTQMPNDYLTAQWGETEGSGFRPLIYIVFEHCYMGNSDTPPPPILYGRRTPNPLGLTAGRHNIKGDANPANMCYEVMTDVIFGMKIPSSKIDVAAFIAVGNTLATEELGLSMVIDTAMKGKDLLAEILRHVDGVIYADPENGLYTIKLARDDYDTATLDIFDQTNIDPDTFEFSRMSWEETANTTVVNYTDRSADFTALPVTYQDLANVFVRNGQVVSETIDFQGFSRPEQAMKAAARANKTRSSPLCRLSFNTNREGYALRPGKVIKVAMPAFGISELVARVTEISYGTLDDPAVKVVCVEDIFVVNTLAYTPPGSGGFNPPGANPIPVAAQRLEEVPHFGAPDDRIYVFSLAAQSGLTDTGYEIWSDPTGGTAYTRTNSTNDFTPTALLSAAYAVNGPYVDETGFTVNSGNNMSQIDAGTAGEREGGKNLVLIGNEILAWRDKIDNGGGSYTFRGVYRAALDTIPEAHAIGDRVWFFSEGVDLIEPDGYSANKTIKAKFLPFNKRGVLAIGSATAVGPLTTTSRTLRPIAPADPQIGTTRFVDMAGTTTGAMTVSWKSRSRLYTIILAQTDPSVDSEAGTTYNLRFYNNATNALIIQKTGMVSLGASAGLAFTGTVRAELESVRGGLLSRSLRSAIFAYDAGGITTSYITADTSIYVLDGGGP